MVLDVNLRAPFEDRKIVRDSLQRADVVKMSDEELQKVAGWFALQGGPRERVAALAESFACQVVCVTRGSQGAALWHDGKWSEHPGFKVEVRDTVGAGAAFLPEARLTLAQADRARRTAQRAAQGETGRLRVGFVEAATHSAILPDVSSFFRMHLPSVGLSFFELPRMKRYRLRSLRSKTIFVVYHTQRVSPAATESAAEGATHE